jgi:hypothetical protein
MNVRRLGSALVLVGITSNLLGCGNTRETPDDQFQRQMKRATECRQMQEKLVGDQPLTPERSGEIAKTMDQAGCAAHFPDR